MEEGGAEKLIGENTHLSPTAFEVGKKLNIGQAFSSRTKFIKHLEEMIPDYYAKMGEKVTPFQQPPAKMRAASSKAPASIDAPAQSPHQQDQVVPPLE